MQGKKLRLAAVCSAVLSAIVLSGCSALGYGSSQPSTDAVTACAASDPKACETVKPLLDKDCKAGDEKACSDLVRLHINDVPDTELGKILVLVAGCTADIADSCAELAARYRAGEGVPLDTAKATVLYRKACDGGNTSACIDYRILADYVAQQLPAVNEQLTGAFDAKDPAILHTVGFAYEHGDIGYPKDMRKASHFYKLACDAGYALSCANLAKYASLKGSASDLNGATSGSIALVNAGMAAETVAQAGKKAPRTSSSAVESAALSLYKKACDGGDAKSCGRVGLAYETGHGVKANKRLAKKYYQKACTLGHVPGCDSVAWFAAHGL